MSPTTSSRSPDERVGFTDTDEPWGLIDEQRDFLVVTKPCRMLSVPGKDPEKADCLIARVQLEFPEARIVHRLDWDTSGIMVLARNARAHSALSKSFQERQTHKRYEALTDSRPEATRGLIDRPIGPDWEHRPRYRIDTEHGRPSQTRYQIIKSNEKCSRWRLEPITGRSHQLRVHLLSLGCPIQGDTLYHPNAQQQPRLMLHAVQLSFRDPESGEPRQYDSPTPF